MFIFVVNFLISFGIDGVSIFFISKAGDFIQNALKEYYKTKFNQKSILSVLEYSLGD